ncbi:hypothetical protein OSB04_028258 [Centaurea solstitialis]|uniref:Reverse transcriptase domain-containing protein n=1 Tax=Centaurea solstitialis TaxID=347529 RepID=A0AA38SYX3_9ASTR|nr:hypothetical protein OSB04_028258 [Centaurea solstitialis]
MHELREFVDAKGYIGMSEGKILERSNMLTEETRWHRNYFNTQKVMEHSWILDQKLVTQSLEKMVKELGIIARDDKVINIYHKVAKTWVEGGEIRNSCGVVDRKELVVSRVEGREMREKGKENVKSRERSTAARRWDLKVNNGEEQGSNPKSNWFGANNLNGKAISYFFTNFPKTWDEKGFWNLFKKLRFEKNLNEIWIGGFKLRVNTVKFSRGKGLEKAVPVKAFVPDDDRKSSLHTKYKSYAEVLRSGVAQDTTMKSQGSEDELVDVHIAKQVKEKMSCFLIRKWGLTIGLRFDGEDKATRFPLENRDIWIRWFISLDHWSNNLRVTHRLAVVSMSGLPSPLLNKELCETFCKDWGDVMEFDWAPSEPGLASKLIVLSEEHSQLHKVIKVRILESIFTVIISEDVSASNRLMEDDGVELEESPSSKKNDDVVSKIEESIPLPNAGVKAAEEGEHVTGKAPVGEMDLGPNSRQANSGSVSQYSPPLIQGVKQDGPLVGSVVSKEDVVGLDISSAPAGVNRRKVRSRKLRRIFSGTGCRLKRCKNRSCEHWLNVGDVIGDTFVETRSQGLDSSMIHELWGNSAAMCETDDAVGSFGGLCIIWDPSFFSSTETIKDSNFLVIIGSWLPKKIVIGIVNVYAPCNATSRELLWQWLMNLFHSNQGVLWLVCGDFNEVRSPDERRDLLAESCSPSKAFMTERGELVNKIKEYETRDLKDLRQQAKVNWLLEGDENSAFFHGYLRNRRRHNHMHGLLWNGNWEMDPSTVKGCVLEFFKEKYSDSNSEQNSFSQAPFLVEEIKQAVWEVGLDKAPSPDGFSFGFIKQFWDVIGVDFIAAVKHFALVPKSKDPLGLNDYRPIHLMGCFSKVVSKVLAGRPKLVIDSVISPEQTAFVKGKNITDGPLIVNEILTWAKRVPKKLFIFKVDFEKAFDNLGWSFLFDVMKQMEFGADFYREGLAVKDATGKGFLNGVYLSNNGPSVSSLHYADDAIFLGLWGEGNIRNLMKILKWFHLALGLNINWNKSTLMGIKVQATEIARVSFEVGCKVGVLPFTYLGFPIGTLMSKESSWKTLYDKCHPRLSGWKTKTLSFGGKITLCKSVLGSLGVFLFSLYNAPNRVVKNIESLRIKFFWGRMVDCRKIPWVAWDKIINDWKKGGLGVGSLKALNVALLSKRWWRFRTDPGSLWKDVIVSLHGKCGSLGINGNDGGNLGVWRKIASINKVTEKINIPLNGLFCKTLGNGAMTEFWKEKWCSSESLENLFPRLATLEENRGCWISDRVSVTESGLAFNWSWRRPLREGREQNDLVNLRSLCERCGFKAERIDGLRHLMAEAFSRFPPYVEHLMI